MKSPDIQSGQPISDQKSDITVEKTDDQIREEARQNFMHPENKPKTVKKNFLQTTLGKAVAIAGSVVVIGAAGIGIDHAIKKSPEPTLVPEIFDPSALKSVIGANDSVMMPIGNYTENAPPIFSTQTNVMTVPVPVIFDSNEVPNLVVEKLRNRADNSLNIITINGLKPGKPLFSPDDGTLIIDPGDAGMQVFFLEIGDFQKEGISIEFSTPDGVTPSINFNLPATATQPVEIPVTKNELIGTINGTSIQMAGNAPGMETFNLGISGGKVILSTK